MGNRPAGTEPTPGRDDEAIDEKAVARIRETRLNDYRWAHDGELRRSERLDTLAVALLAATVPSGALVANTLKDQQLKGWGVALVVVFIVALLGCTALAMWARASYLIWTPSHRLTLGAASASPAESVRTRWASEPGLGPIDVEQIDADELRAWQRRLESAEANAHAKSLLTAGAMGCLLIAAIDLPLLLTVAV